MPDSIRTVDDKSIESTVSIWTLSNSSKPAAELHHIQKVLDGRIAVRAVSESVVTAAE